MAKWNLLLGVAIGGAATVFATKLLRRTTNVELPASEGRSPAQGFSITFGNPAEHQMFAREYSGFLIEWRELQEFTKEVMLNRTISPPDIEPLKNLPDDDPLVLVSRTGAFMRAPSSRITFGLQDGSSGWEP